MNIKERLYGISAVRKIYTFIGLGKKAQAKRIVEEAESLIDCYLDEESIELLRIRENYIQEGNGLLWPDFIDCCTKYGHKFRIPEIDSSYYRFAVLSFGEKDYDAYLIKLLRSIDGNIVRIVTSFEEVQDEEMLIFGTWNKVKYGPALEEIEKNWPKVKYVKPLDTALCGICGHQYFDVFNPQNSEVFIDGGSFDGETAVEFSQWANNNYKRIYAYESDAENVIRIKQTVLSTNIKNVEVIGKGLWSEDKILYFTGSAGTTGSGVSEIGNVEIPVTSIDNSIAEEDVVTFIKFDIEGAELEALKGAEKTIRRDAPKLAICLYHKPEDIAEIPRYIHQINSNYKFKIRHYLSICYEDVLFASTNVNDFCFEEYNF